MTHLYLASYVGDGTAGNEYRPPTDQPGWSAVDLRPDASQPEGLCVVRVPQQEDIGAYIGTLDEVPNVPGSRGIENQLGLPRDSLRDKTLRQIIADVLVLWGDDADAGRWNPLKARLVDGLQRIWLGEWIWQQHVPMGGASESFDQADSTVLGPDLTWAELTTDTGSPQGDWETISNEATNRSGVDEDVMARAEHDLASADHYSQAPMYGESSQSAAAGTAVRFAPDANTCYRGGPNVVAQDTRIFKFVNNAKTLLVNTAKTLSAGTVYDTRTEVEGSTIRCLIDSVEEVTTTDTAITGNTRTGIGYYTSGTGSDRRWFFQSFEAGDLSAGVTGTLGQAVEADTAHPVTPSLAGGLDVPIGQAVETSTAQPLTAGKTQTIGQAQETDTAHTITAARTHTLGQAQEADSAQPLTAGKTATLGQVTETDTAHPLTSGRSVTLGQATETDTAHTLTWAKAVTLGLASETDTAQPIAVGQGTPIGQAVETDTAQPLTVHQSTLIGQAQEVDTAHSLTPARTHTLGQAVEVDTAQTVTPARSVTLGQAQESDTAHTISHAKAFVLGQAVETDTAQPISVPPSGLRDLTVDAGPITAEWSVAEVQGEWATGPLRGEWSTAAITDRTPA